MYQVGFRIFDTAGFWFGLILVTTICLLPNLAIKYLQTLYWPHNFQIIQEEEKLDGLNRSGDSMKVEKIHSWTSGDELSDASPSQSFAIRKALKTLS